MEKDGSGYMHAACFPVATAASVTHLVWLFSSLLLQRSVPPSPRLRAAFDMATCGMQNLGASCWVNSVLQALFSTPPIQQKIAGPPATDTEAKLQRLYNACQTSTHPVVPAEILEEYYAGRQEDAMGFLETLLCECTNVAMVVTGVEAPKLRCQHCGWQKTAFTTPTFTALQLALPTWPPLAPPTMGELLANYLEETSLLEKAPDNWFCQETDCLNANRAEDAPMHVPDVNTWPSVLILQIKRWEAAGNRLRNDPVQCENTVIVRGHKYALVTVICHIGADSDSGHYVTYARDGTDWVLYNDSRVSRHRGPNLSVRHDMEKPYIAFYKKMVFGRPLPSPVGPMDLDDDAAQQPASISIEEGTLAKSPASNIPTRRFDQGDDEDTEEFAKEVEDFLDNMKKRADPNLSEKDDDVDMTEGTEVMEDNLAPDTEDAGAKQKMGKSRKRKYNLSSEDGDHIATALRTGTSVREVLQIIRTAIPDVDYDDRQAEKYISRSTVRNWWQRPDVFDKAMARNRIVPPSTQPRVQASTRRASLTPEQKRTICDALETAESAPELEQALQTSLPGFSTTDAHAETYIPRTSLRNWVMRPNVKTWFTSTDESWNTEWTRTFGVAIHVPAKRDPRKFNQDDRSSSWLRDFSWAFCPLCGHRRPMPDKKLKDPLCKQKVDVACTPCCDAAASDLLAPPASSESRKLMCYVTPTKDCWQLWLDHMQAEGFPFTQCLTNEELQSLAVVTIEIQYRSRRGGKADIVSKQKRSVVRCRWQPTSMLQSSRSGACAKAFDWLMAHNLTYNKFVHVQDAQSKSGLANWQELPTATLLLNSPGIEIAARPWLYPLPSFGDTDILTRLHPLGWVEKNSKPSIRTSFLRKVLSRCIDYSRDYALQALMYDICMARTISSVVAIAIQKKVAAEQIASDMDMFDGYWAQQLRKLEDICRQEFERTASREKSLPNVFFTIAPGEWRFPLHDGIFAEDSLSNQQSLVTLHLYHAILRMLDIHFFKDGISLQKVGIESIRQHSLRFEFQSRGTLHVHVILWCDLLPGCNAIDLTAKTGGPVRTAFVEVLESIFKSSVDVQCGDGTHVLLRYVAGYLVKASDALQFQSAQAKHKDENEATPWRMTYRLLSKKSPLEQEVIMELAGVSMVKHSFSGVAVFAPIPGSKAKNTSRDHYEAYQKCLLAEPNSTGCARGLTFIQWLRRFRVVCTDSKTAIATRNERGPTAGKDCGVAMTFPFEMLDIYLGAWAASCLPDILEVRLHPSDSPDEYPARFADELRRRQSFKAPDGCQHLKAVLCLDNFQADAAPPGVFFPDLNKLFSLLQPELEVRGLGVDRIRSFKARVEASTILLLKIRDGKEDHINWTARPIPGMPERIWSQQQKEVLERIADGISVEDATAALGSCRILQVAGGPGTGKTEVVIAATNKALRSGCKVLIAGPIGLLVSMYRTKLPPHPNLTMETLHSAFQVVRDKDAPYVPPGRLRHFDLIIFDEISQIEAEVWEKLKVALSELQPGPFVVFVGDFQQLQPIHGGPCLREDLRTQVEQGELPLVVLQHHPGARSVDPLMLNFLEGVRKVQPSRQSLCDFFEGRIWPANIAQAVWNARNIEDEEHCTFTFLTVTNKGAAAFNHARLWLSFPWAARAIEAGQGIPTDKETVVLEEGMRLRLTWNVDKTRGFVNGQTGIVRAVLRPDVFVLLSDQGTSILVHPISVRGRKFLPVTYGWATTMRRAQGSTLDRVCLSFDRRVADRGYAYVGLSRVKMQAHVYHFGKLRRTDWRPVGGQAHPQNQDMPSVLSETSSEEDDRSAAETETASEEDRGPDDFSDSGESEPSAGDFQSPSPSH